jgi:hypothetical protein
MGNAKSSWADQIHHRSKSAAAPVLEQFAPRERAGVGNTSAISIYFGRAASSRFACATASFKVAYRQSR